MIPRWVEISNWKTRLQEILKTIFSQKYIPTIFVLLVSVFQPQNSVTSFSDFAEILRKYFLKKIDHEVSKMTLIDGLGVDRFGWSPSRSCSCQKNYLIGSTVAISIAPMALRAKIIRMGGHYSFLPMDYQNLMKTKSNI